MSKTPADSPLAVMEASLPSTGTSPGSRVGQSQSFIYANAFNLAVLIAGLGYCVDIYDFFLYNSMRVVSLTELGLSGDTLTKIGIFILNSQILGALIGSFVWGVLGDKIGRKKALLGSIFIYSIAMLANAFVQDSLTYGIVRFVLGFGVAGEVGLGATLIAETVHASKRTYALMFFTVMGVLGVTIAGASVELASWRTSCLVGGIIGLLLLTLRGLLFESPLFLEKAGSASERGSLKDLFGRAATLKRFLLCIPILGCNFFVTGLLLTLSPEIARAMQTQEIIRANLALGIYFLCATLGDCLGAWLSETFKSRKLVAALFILANAALAFAFLHQSHLSAFNFYALCASFGLCNLWAITATIVVEQFPTRFRATATTANFNCSRATVVLMNLMLLWLKPSMGMIQAFTTVAIVVFAAAILCLPRLCETYGRSLANDGQ